MFVYLFFCIDQFFLIIFPSSIFCLKGKNQTTKKTNIKLQVKFPFLYPHRASFTQEPSVLGPQTQESQSRAAAQLATGGGSTVFSAHEERRRGDDEEETTVEKNLLARSVFVSVAHDNVCRRRDDRTT